MTPELFKDFGDRTQSDDENEAGAIENEKVRKRRLWLALLFDDPLLFIMRTDPHPDEILSVLNGQ
jgi:hypothetical protein